jgi:hypothetical protein
VRPDLDKKILAKIRMPARQPEEAAEAKRQMIRLVKQKWEKMDSTPGADVTRRTFSVCSLQFSGEILKDIGDQEEMVKIESKEKTCRGGGTGTAAGSEPPLRVGQGGIDILQVFHEFNKVFPLSAVIREPCQPADEHVVFPAVNELFRFHGQGLTF